MIQTAVVVGATGLVGRHLVQELMSDPLVNSVVALVRRPLSLLEYQNHPRLKQIVVDFENLEASKLAFTGSHFFSCLGTTIAAAGSKAAFKKVDYDLILNCAKMAVENGTSHGIFISSLGADANARVFYSRVKGEAEAAVQGLGFQSVTCLRPSLLLGPRSALRLGEWLAQKTAPLWNPLMVGRLKKFRAVSASTVARAMVRAAKMDVSGGRFIESDEIQTLGA